MSFDPSTVYLVDTIDTPAGHTNFLVRGNEPLLHHEHGAFAYSQLADRLAELIAGFDLTKSKLIDVSVIDVDTKQHKHLCDEFKAFAQDFDSLYPAPNWPPFFQGQKIDVQHGSQIAGNAGSVVWFPIQDCTDDDNCQLVEPSQFDYLNMMNWVTSLLHTEQGAVVYIHCEHGHDRTGAFVMSYMMASMGQTLAEALENGNPFPEPVEPAYIALVTWYANQLRIL